MKNQSLIATFFLIWFLIMPAPFLGQALNQKEIAKVPENMIKIPEGKFRHFFKKQNEDFVIVKAFYLDVYAVTNAEFLLFVKSNPQWAKSKVSRLFADTNYLKHWESDFSLGENENKIKNSPVTNVSWYAVNAYCKWKGKRLATTTEWEYAGGVELDKNEKYGEATLLKVILDWYSKPTPEVLPEIGSTFKNQLGVYDMHGLIWEWVFDFNNNITSGDARGKDAIDRNLFCGSGSNSAINKEDYAAFMRYGFRESLKGAYTVANLGFRCAMDIPEK